MPKMKKMLAPILTVESGLSWAAVSLVRLYQRGISPILPPVCRFRPSCSQYMIEAITRKGLVVGLLKGIWRVVRCNPLFPGGYDPVG